MVVVGLVLAVLAGLLHVAIFGLESLAWTGERARATFGTTPAEAEATREMAFNQGFYNLFLAILAIGGAITVAAGARTVGLTLALAGIGSMLGAALVLLASSRAHRAAAIKQGTLPLLAVLALVVSLAV